MGLTICPRQTINICSLGISKLSPLKLPLPYSHDTAAIPFIGLGLGPTWESFEITSLSDLSLILSVMEEESS